MNTIRDKQQNVAFGLNMQKSYGLFEKEAGNLVGDYITPVLVQAAKKEKPDVFVKSPIEHIKLWEADTNTNQYSLDITKVYDNNYRATYGFTEPGAKNKTIYYEGTYFKSLKEVIQSLTETNVKNAIKQLNKNAKFVANENRQLKIAEKALNRLRIKEKIADSAFTIKDLGVKPEIIKNLDEISPEHFSFKFEQTEKGYKILASSTQYPHAGWNEIGTLDKSSTQAGLSAKELEKFETETLKPKHDTKVSILNARNELIKILSQKGRKGLYMHEGDRTLIDAAINDGNLDLTGINKLIALSNNEKLKGIELITTDSVFYGGNEDAFLSFDRTPKYYPRLFDKSEYHLINRKNFFQKMIEKLEDVEGILAGEQAEIAQRQTWKTYIKETEAKVKELVETMEFKTKFPHETSKSIIANYSNYYTPEILNKLIKETPDLVFNIHKPFEGKDQLGFFVGSKKHPEAGYVCMHKYNPNETSVDLDSNGELVMIHPRQKVKENLTVEKVIKFAEDVLPQREKEIRETNAIKDLFSTNKSNQPSKSLDIPVEEFFIPK